LGEGVVLGILLPGILASSGRAGAGGTVAEKAGSGAKALTVLATSIDARSPRTTTAEQLVNLLAHSSQLRNLGFAGSGGMVPGPGRQCRSGPNVEALISVSGTVLASSRPGLCPRGARLGFAALPGLAGRGGPGHSPDVPRRLSRGGEPGRLCRSGPRQQPHSEPVTGRSIPIAVPGGEGERGEAGGARHAPASARPDARGFVHRGASAPR